MRYVIDASVAVTSVVSRPLTSKALRLRQEYRQGIHELLAPSIFSAEVASALTKCERQKIFPVGDALPLLDDILSELPQFHAYEPLLRRATTEKTRRSASGTWRAARSFSSSRPNTWLTVWRSTRASRFSRRRFTTERSSCGRGSDGHKVGPGARRSPTTGCTRTGSTEDVENKEKLGAELRPTAGLSKLRERSVELNATDDPLDRPGVGVDLSINRGQNPTARPRQPSAKPAAIDQVRLTFDDTPTPVAQKRVLIVLKLSPKLVPKVGLEPTPIAASPR